MKKLLLIIAIMLCANLIYAQTEKGSLYLSGSSMLDMSFNSWEVENGETMERDITRISFVPSIGVFIADNLALGIDLVYSHYKDEYEEDYESKETSLIVMPVAKYYIPMENNFRPFIHAGIGWKKWKMEGEEEDIDADGMVVGGGLGFAYFIKDNISLDLGLNYLYSKVSDEVYNLDTDLKEGILNIRFGVTVFFY